MVSESTNIHLYTFTSLLHNIYFFSFILALGDDRRGEFSRIQTAKKLWEFMKRFKYSVYKKRHYSSACKPQISQTPESHPGKRVVIYRISRALNVAARVF